MVHAWNFCVKAGRRASATTPRPPSRSGFAAICWFARVLHGHRPPSPRRAILQRFIPKCMFRMERRLALQSCCIAHQGGRRPYRLGT